MDNKVVFAILTLLFNQIGLTGFLTGKTMKSVGAILSAAITLGVVGIINAIKGILNAIKIFQMSDEDFAAANKADLVDVLTFFWKD